MEEQKNNCKNISAGKRKRKSMCLQEYKKYVFAATQKVKNTKFKIHKNTKYKYEHYWHLQF